MDVITKHAKEIERNLNRVQARKAGSYTPRSSALARDIHSGNGAVKSYGPASRTPRITAAQRKQLNKALSKAIAFHNVHRDAQSQREVHRLSDLLKQMIGDGE